MRVNKLSTDTGKGYLITKPEVRCPTDNGCLLSAQIYSRQSEAVSIRMGVNSRYLTNNDIFPITANDLHPLDLGASHRQPISQISRGQSDIHIFLKPL